MGYQVITPLVIARDTEGRDLYFYQDAVLSPNLADGEVERLLEGNFIQEIEGGDSDAGDGPPAKSANKPEWAAYAVSQGLSEEDADAATKDELIEKFGG